ncbi:MAG: HDOD domain-containing protein [Myxococcota bacterium]|nr:HDOD domain-containing protein [Myxococcota bacterium]
MNLAGRVLARYRLVTELGSGGMGSVWFAEHVSIGRRAAVKVLDPVLARDERLVDRFFAEARAVNAIRHPNIVDVVDCAREDDCCFLVMELLEGETLGARLERRGRLDLAELVAHVRQIAAALDAVHARGMVHRDLKPENVFLVSRDRQAELVKVLDFGIVKLTEGPTTRTSQGTLLGTPAYMSPEQCSGRLEVDARSDLYSLGVLIFEALTGRLPFERESTLQLLVAHQLEPAPDLRELRSDVPRALAEVVGRTLAKSPFDRPASALELADALTEALRDERAVVSASARAPSTPPAHRPPRPARSTEASTMVGRLAAPLAERATLASQPGVVAPPAPGQPSSTSRVGLPATRSSLVRGSSNGAPPSATSTPRTTDVRAAQPPAPPERKTGPSVAVIDAPPAVRRGQARRVGSRLVDIVEARIEDGRLELPAMPEVCVECLSLLDARQPLARVAGVAARDPLLAARALRLANSTASAARTRIVELEGALVRIGTEQFRVVLVEVAARGVFLSRDPRVRATMRAIWEESQRVSEVAGRLAERVAPDRRAAARTAGLLRDIGRPVLAALIADVERTLQTGARSWMSAEVFGAIVDKHHASVARRVAEHWRLPPDAIDAVEGDSLEDRSTASVVRLAHALVRRRQIEDVVEARRLDSRIDTGVGIFGVVREELEALVPHGATDTTDARAV